MVDLHVHSTCSDGTFTPEELVDYAIDKGTPVLEKTANSIREKAIDVTKEVLDKLEKKDSK